MTLYSIDYLKWLISSSPVIRGYSQGQVAFYVFRHDLTKPEYNLINYELTKNAKADNKHPFGFPAFYSFFFFKEILFLCTVMTNCLLLLLFFFITSTIYGYYI